MSNPSVYDPTTASLSSGRSRPDVHTAKSALRLAGWTTVWVQLIAAVVSAVLLVAAIFSRSIGDEGRTAATGFAMVLAGGGLLILLFSLFTAFRCTRFARIFQKATPDDYPETKDIVDVLVLGLIASLIGLGVSLLGAEVGLGMLLAKSLTQPQGVALYDPGQIIRVLDILVPIINANLVAAFFLGEMGFLWMIRRIQG